jgi:hypothetical protein
MIDVLDTVGPLTASVTVNATEGFAAMMLAMVYSPSLAPAAVPVGTGIFVNHTDMPERRLCCIVLDADPQSPVYRVMVVPETA